VDGKSANLKAYTYSTSDFDGTGNTTKKDVILKLVEKHHEQKAEKGPK
jgi:hypothetical protein